jgi:hypothetical protein
MDQAVHLRVAQPCIDAGADTELIESWIQEAQRRAAQAR